jgi:TM2 domain-containing membrane protein YozV
MKKIIGVIIILIFLSQTNVKGQYSSELKLKENNSSSLILKKNSNISPKEPVLAGFFSFIIPGFAIGQIYNEQPLKALIHTSITVTSLVIAIISLSGISFSVGGSTSNDKSWGAVPFLISFGVFTVNWIWSVVDAVISANDINKKARLKKYRTPKNHEINFRIGLDNDFRFKTALYF